MYTIHNDTVLVNKQTTALQGFRLEDTIRAPTIILFVDQEPPELIPLQAGQTPPTIVKSANMEAEIQIITYAEIETFMNRGAQDTPL